MEKSFIDGYENLPTVQFDSGSRPTRGREVNFTGYRFGADSCYEFESLHGEGGMGQVWAGAKHTADAKRRVAIKIVRPERWSAYANELFQREMRMHEMLADVPGVVALHECGSFTHPQIAGPIHYIIMDWIDAAKPLDRACAKKPWNQRLKIMSRVCEIVGGVHAKGMVHCDIKPHNILVNNRNEVFLTDFGLTVSKDVDSYGDQINSIRGTWAYMAPEQCEPGCDPHAFLPALDVYSLCVTFFECLTGKVPYAIDASEMGASQTTRDAIAVGATVPRRVGGRTLPTGMVALLRRGVMRDPSDRFADAHQLGRAIQKLLRWSSVSDYITIALIAIISFLVIDYQLDKPVNTDAVRESILGIMPPIPVETDRLCVVAVNVSDDFSYALEIPAGSEIKSNMRQPRYGIAKVTEKLAAAGVRTLAIATSLPSSPSQNRAFAAARDLDPAHSPDPTLRPEQVILRDAARKVSVDANDEKKGRFFISMPDFRADPVEGKPTSYQLDEQLVTPHTEYVARSIGGDGSGLDQFGVAFKPLDGPVELGLAARVALGFLNPLKDFGAELTAEDGLTLLHLSDGPGPDNVTRRVPIRGIHFVGDLAEYFKNTEDPDGTTARIYDGSELCAQGVLRTVLTRKHRETSVLEAETVMNWKTPQLNEFIGDRAVVVARVGDGLNYALHPKYATNTVAEAVAVMAHALVHEFAPERKSGRPLLIRQLSISDDAVITGLAALALGIMTRQRVRRVPVSEWYWGRHTIVVTVFTVAGGAVATWALFYYHANFWNPLPAICAGVLATVTCAVLPWWKR